MPAVLNKITKFQIKWANPAAIILFIMLFSAKALAYSSPDIPVGHWSYQAAEKLIIAGLASVSGTSTLPMTRAQMADKIKEAIDNIQEDKLPTYLCLDREYIEYLQTILYKLINEFRPELAMIGVTTVEKPQKTGTAYLGDVASYNLLYPVEAENRFASVADRKDVLLENQNGLRLERGYNLRTRASGWLNLNKDDYLGLTVSARPELRVTESKTNIFFDEAAAKFSVLNMEVSLAKSAMWWGPGYEGSMLLSNNAKPLTIVKIRSVKGFQLPWEFKHLGLFGINFFVSRLEKDRNVPNPGFAGLRLEWSPLPYLTVTANRTSIFGGKGRPKPTLRDYWKIFVARGKDEFTASGEDAKASDSDQLASFDVKFILPLKPEAVIGSGLETYAEWAGEDRFAFWENESSGFLLGMFLTDLLRFKGTDFRVEYAKNKPSWYNQGVYNAAGGGTAYTYQGELMGHHMGGDADDFFVRISKDMPFLSTPYFDTVRTGCDLDIERHGITELNVERKIEAAFDTVWTHTETFFFSIRYEFEYYENFNHVSDKTARNHIFLAEADVKF